MTEQELKKFKQIVESDLVTEKINEVEKHERASVIASLLNYLMFTKDYENIEYYLSSFLFNDYNEVCVLPTNFLNRKQNLTELQAAELMYNSFMKEGYLYHVTKTSNLDSILENGIVTLNKRFNENLYEECIKINKSFNRLLERNNKIQMDLIKIPLHKNLYENRFNSIYLSTNLQSALNIYGTGMEIFLDFVNRWRARVGVCSRDINLPKEELRQRLIEGMKHYQYEVQELELLLNFYDKHYEPIKPENKFDEKAIIMIPNKNIEETTTSASCGRRYDNLVRDKENFMDNYLSCVDLECSCEIASDDLIGITIGEDNSLKVHKKIK